VDRKSLQYFNGEESDLENASHVGDSSDVESSSLDYDSIHHGAGKNCVFQVFHY